MPDPTLHGNGHTCPACELRREADRARTVFGSSDTPCNQCNSIGRIAKSAAQIVSEEVAWAREHYWGQKQYA
ncbi:hypothetical protein [Albirhodobacter sp. R86504]|uniref:hypothetical protein n=1 Tax=Albirhodobacter sp. R86504 TaxID=3093848 RepID=UPI00366E4F85